ncbi:CheR family methyltransferase [Martelella endophytica]|uniref:Blue-light-activated histidine kinase n=1 Tax=Martelella endophytica TaxID=1486262 RepID=A0A0D5LU29_MAREN|nr:CheR family methyltransferase [Martelella endophytica]AJY47277.1 chemotaxis protein CheR [Martelella endophytica]
MTLTPRTFLTVGVSASARDIAAVERFFRGLPQDHDMAFVLLIHHHKEAGDLVETLRSLTSMRVMKAEDGQQLEKHNVYLATEDTSLSIRDGAFCQLPPSETSDLRPADTLLSSIAKDQGDHAAAVILSVPDGMLGAKAIKEQGGLTLAQTSDTSSAKSGFFRNALRESVIDITDDAASMGQRLADYARGFVLLADLERDDDHIDRILDAARLSICSVLKEHTGHDFSGYKTKTFLRRVRRRMQLKNIEKIDDYLDFFQKEKEEVDAFYRDLLINVTSFFRDARAFEILASDVLPRIFKSKGASDSVRIWVPGCATGEEVYSIAILVREYLNAHDGPKPRIQIFATDIDEDALTIARAGRYPEILLEGVSAERRRRFFNRDGNTYVVKNDIRELCIFSPHSVIQDPPYSRMELVSCRNLLIYFGPELQNRVIPTFHYALKPTGYLFLGTSESVGRHSDLFTPVDKRNRIYQASPYANPTSHLRHFFGETPGVTRNISGRGESRRSSSFALTTNVEKQVLEHFSPPHVVTDKDGDIVYYSARTGQFLEAQQGLPNRQLLAMAKYGLRLELRAAFAEAVARGERVVRENVAFEQAGDRAKIVRITVEPLSHEKDVADPLYLVLFETTGTKPELSDRQTPPPGADAIAGLERELQETRERMHSTIEEYETALEELKSSYEELMSVNEEAQSTNEELEASKEEMQSLNEELGTINAELNSKIEELGQVNNDLKHLFASTEIATIFLDKSLVVRNFTPAASVHFNLRSHDVGRPLTELSSTLDYPDLADDLATVLRTETGLERHIPQDGGARTYLARILPYRTADGTTDGAVFTLTDITNLKEAEAHQQVLISELNHRVKNMLAVVSAVADQMLDSSSSMEQYHRALIGRLDAMSRAYVLLSREQWRQASIRQILTAGLEPISLPRIILDGPELKVAPETSLALGMVVHELATNAAKYGALSTNDGTVEISWLVGDGQFQMNWHEKCEVSIDPPESHGFGSSLIKGEISYRLGGTFETEYAPSGLIATIRIPFEKLNAAEE